MERANTYLIAALWAIVDGKGPLSACVKYNVQWEFMCRYLQARNLMTLDRTIHKSRLKNYLNMYEQDQSLASDFRLSYLDDDSLD